MRKEILDQEAEDGNERLREQKTLQPNQKLRQSADFSDSENQMDGWDDLEKQQ